MVFTRARRLALHKEQCEVLAAASQNFLRHAHAEPPTPTPDIRNYTLLTKLGEGAYATVYVARDPEANIVALKVQKKENLRRMNMGAVVAFNEKIFLRGLKSEFVVKFGGTWRSANYLVMVMEFAPHGDFMQLAEMAPLAENRALFYFAQVVCALEYVHACNIIYADLKPDNCLIFPKGRVKLGDFGLSRYGLDNRDGAWGNFLYAAPEALMNTSFTDKVDWWAFGVMAHFMLLQDYPVVGFWDDEEDALLKVAQPDPYPLPKLDSSTLTPAGKDLIRRFLIKDFTKRLGANGGQEVQHHPWFHGVDFNWVRSTNFEIPVFELPRVSGRACDPDILKKDGPEEADPNYQEFLQY